MTEFSNKSVDMLEEAFFSIVNGEIFAWEALEMELRNRGVPITVGRLVPLHCLVDGSLRLQELTERIHAKPSAASRLIERMVRDGLVEKQRDGNDGRAVLLHATDEGRRIEAQGRAAFESCMGELFGDLDETEIRTLCKLIGRLRNPAAEASA